MSIPCAVLMCHAPIVLPQIAGKDAARCQLTTHAMHEAARALLAHEPDVVVLVSPHAPRTRTGWGISHEENLTGSFARFGHSELALSFRGAPRAARALAAAAETAQLSSHALPAQALDHGALVPLYFLREASSFLRAASHLDAASEVGAARYMPRILLVALPYPDVSTQPEVSFGAAVRAAALALGERWAVLASGDMSHRLTPGAPGGYEPRARDFDRCFVELVQRGDLRSAIALPSELVECAGEDCVQSTAVAAGAVRFATDGAHTFGYEGPFGVGYCEALIYSENATTGERRRVAEPSARAPHDPERVVPRATASQPAPEELPYRLVEIALAAIERSLRGERRLVSQPLAPPWDAQRPVFVTLRSPDGELRGCIGRTAALFPTLVDEVIDCAIGAATRDPRMRSVEPSELSTLQLEVSVLAPAEPIAGPQQLEPARYGVIAQQETRRGTRRAVLLPGIAGIDTAIDQLRAVLHKAGIDPTLPYQLERFTVDKVVRKTLTPGTNERSRPARLARWSKDTLGAHNKRGPRARRTIARGRWGALVPGGQLARKAICLSSPDVPSPSFASTSPQAHEHGHGEDRSFKSLAALSLGALGIVYGDIGTSPLYALRECLVHVGPSEEHVLGIVSLVFWSLVLVVIIKYLTFILRADHNGEGGVLALLTLARRKGRSLSARKGVLLWFGLAGAALLLADGMITPAISVLSAVEGLEVAAPGVRPFVLPIAIGILILLFSVQKRGTTRIGALFGPAVMLWFISIAAVSLPWILREPKILTALDPRHGMRLLFESSHGFTVLGSVVLCVTGGEALYADLGHFGARPIRIAWYVVVFPALVLSYLGQGAYVLLHPTPTVGNIFFELVPQPLLFPMVAIATVAATVAAQALISGVYSLTQQAVQLGYLPRMTIIHTSGDMEGRIYVPQVNSLLMVSCIGLVIGFRTSSSLGAAYGIAVTGTMVVTSVLFFAAMRRQWGNIITGLLVLSFLFIDVGFLAANLIKLAHGGWFPVLMGAFFVAIATSWRAGAEAVRRYHVALNIPLTEFLATLGKEGIARVKGTSVFLARDDKGAPPTLVHYVKHSHALHERVILLTMKTDRVPRVADPERILIEDLGDGFIRIEARYGFMESPSVGRVLEACQQQGLPVVPAEATVFVGHSSVQPTGKAKMAHWRKRLFAFMNRNARPAALYYGLSPEQVIEIGVRMDI